MFEQRRHITFHKRSKEKIIHNLLGATCYKNYSSCTSHHSIETPESHNCTLVKTWEISFLFKKKKKSMIGMKCSSCLCLPALLPFVCVHLISYCVSPTVVLSLPISPSYIYPLCQVSLLVSGSSQRTFQCFFTVTVLLDLNFVFWPFIFFGLCWKFEPRPPCATFLTFCMRRRGRAIKSHSRGPSSGLAVVKRRLCGTVWTSRLAGAGILPGRGSRLRPLGL